MKTFLKTLLLTTISTLILIGCSGNPTNEASVEDINKAVEKKFKAIDEDPNLTPEQKTEMKKHMGGPAGNPGAGRS